MRIEADWGAVAARAYGPTGDNHEAQVTFFGWTDEERAGEPVRVRDSYSVTFHSHADARAFARDILNATDAA